jgi:cytochrome c-type biogenesis protein CcmE
VAETFRENLVFFATPTELLNTKEKSQGDLKKQHKRLGGLVKKGSVRVESAKERHLVFTVTDLESDVVVQYRGFLPDLFREGQGVVAQGTFDPRTKIFTATKIMAKHDETYKPPEVRRALDKATLSETLSAVDMGGTKNNTDSKDAEK